VDTTGVAPTSHPLALSAPLRDDETRPSLPRDEVLKGAPDADLGAGLFKVPRVLGA
jgi:aspartyl-tRNA(Asn)/glutamyl-tRNA(Gln) amidotransferase subunit C